MIASFRSKALERFWRKGNRKGVRADQVERLVKFLTALDAAARAKDVDQRCPSCQVGETK